VADTASIDYHRSLNSMPLLFRIRQAAKGLALRAALPFMVKRQPLPELLVSLDWPTEPNAPAGDGARLLAERLFQPLRFWPTTCLYRALGSYALLRAAGQEVRFVIGVRKEGETLLAHAWLERDGQAIVGAPGPGQQYAVAYAWPADPSTFRNRRALGPASGISRSADVVLTELQDGSGVLLHLQTRYYFTLNASGVQVWKLLGAGARDPAELATGLSAAFPDAEPNRVRADIDALLADLTRESLVIVRS
jgi:hypothetical protein